jgi:cytochrome c nitrite reductase small subunit
VGLLVIAGVVCGLGGLFMYLLRAHTYFVGDNPSACVNCHIMTPYYATWSHSSHGRIDNQKNGATCNDCHVPHQNLAVYYGFKAVDGLKHTAYFVGHMEHQAIKAETLTGQVVMDNCIRCHEQLNTEFVKTGRMGYMQQQAQAAIGLDMQKLNENKQKFLQEIEPKWIEEAKKNGKLIEI